MLGEKKDENDFLLLMNKIFYKDYQLLFKKGRKIYSPLHIIYYIDFHKQVLKTAAKKKLGNAVKRNYEKRIIRDILTNFSFKKSYFILVICQKTFKCDFKGKISHFEQLLKPLVN